MNTGEALELVAVVGSLCPGMKLGQHTAKAWQLVLNDVRLVDALEAVRTCYRDRGNDAEFGARRVEADDILREVRRIRSARIAAVSEDDLTPPAGLSVADDVAWRRAALRAVADGERVPDNGRHELVRRDMRQALTSGPQQV